MLHIKALKEKTAMKRIENLTMDQERALYGSTGLIVSNCRFDGPADGESAFKECRSVRAENCFMNLRYPFWHDTDLEIADCEMTELCRAALWYSQDIRITGSKLHGIKALRECRDVRMENCDVISPEFGWNSCNVTMDHVSNTGEYFMFQGKQLRFSNVTLKGKYSFQYIEDSIFENCRFDTKDAFWHARNVVVKNSRIKGEYLAWYCENVTFENCVISGTQPLCYCKNLKLVNCEMLESDLAFEKSEVQASITAPMLSIKNPLSGRITVPAVGEIIMDDPDAKGEVVVG